MRRVVVALAVLAALTGAAAARAGSLQAQRELADRFAPVVELVEQQHECGRGEPYRPIDIDTILGDDTVALRGPWSGANLVAVGPTAAMLGRGLFDYHLDFPGNPLDAGCGYEQWQQAIMGSTRPTVYAHVATQRGYPHRLALQYWFFYVFNDFGNPHEGDWEMIQLDFDAADAGQAIAEKPTDVGYSQHEGAERAEWGDEKLDVVDGTHPVVFVADGSHANFYDSALFVGRAAEEGVGCDDTRGPHTTLIPAVRTIPAAPAAARAAYPWIAFLGRWGELRPAFFNGPTGPNLKLQWAEPFTWSQGWRERSYAIPAGGVIGTNATDFFCQAVTRGSNALRRFANQPSLVLGVIVVLVALIGWLASKTRWRPTAPLRVVRRRSWGQMVTASWRMYARRPLVFTGIGLLTIPISIVLTLVQSAILHVSSFLGLAQGGEGGGDRALLVLAIGVFFSLFGLCLVQAASARAMVEIDAGRPVGMLRAYRLALDRVGPLLRALVIAVPVVALLTLSLYLIPIAVVFAVRWALFVPCAELGGAGGYAALRRSAALVSRRWPTVLSLVVVTAFVVLLSGPVLGGVLLLATGASFALVNAVAGLVYALAMPLVGITTTYVYFDVVTREHLAPAEQRADELPAEFALPDPR
ncbi:MAG TPA: hypothetical protein VH538_08805 [Gaiellaceae bacterium]